MNRFLSFMAITCLVFTGCSVFMAAKKEGVSVEKLSGCKTRSCLIAKGAEPIDSKKDESGCLVEETYKCRKPKGSSGRAAMHGVLDVLTLGIWEVAGTPIEGSKGKEEYYSVKVFFEDGENIKKIELVQ